jgi:hypothetical protein
MFKFGRGDFFGIIFPGAFLIANFIYLYFPNIVQNEKSDTMLFIVMLILSYIAGILLRLLRPDYFETFPPEFGKDKVIIKDNKEVEIGLGRFPFIKWHLNTHLNHLPNSYRDYFKSYISKEFGDDIPPIREKIDKDFVNYCKTVICMKSDSLYEEILYAEGLSRLISGMGYALLICALLVLIKIYFIYTQSNVHIWPYVFLCIFYLMICLFLKLQFKRVRGKEATTVFEAYALLMKEEQNKKKALYTTGGRFKGYRSRNLV